MLHPFRANGVSRTSSLDQTHPLSIGAATALILLALSFVAHDFMRSGPEQLRLQAGQALELAHGIGETLNEFSQAVIKHEVPAAEAAGLRLQGLIQNTRRFELEAQMPLVQLQRLQQQPFVFADRAMLDVLRAQATGMQRALTRYGRDYLAVGAEQSRAVDSLFQYVTIVVLLLSTLALYLARHVKKPNVASTDLNEQQRESLAEALLDHTRDSICYADCDGFIQHVNAVYCRLTGYSAEEVVGQHIDFNLASSPTGDSHSASAAMSSLLANGSWRGDLWRRTRTGEVYVEQTRRLLLRDNAGLVTGLLTVASDPGMARETERLLLWQATHDPLTKLPNRSLFIERMAHLTQGVGDESHAAVLLLDIDRFKGVNDGIGHSAGDQLLIDATYRLAMAVRDQDTLARINGDQFGILASAPASAAEAERIARNVMAQFAEPFSISGRDIYLSISIGIATYPGDGESVGSLMQSAEGAMKEVKANGRNGYRFFESAMNRAAARRLDLENGLRKALTLGELHLVYQPIVDAHDQRVASVETLLRWDHAEWGSIAPSEFIPVAEDSGLIVPIGIWIAESVKAQLAEWHARGITDFRVAINVSGRQLLTAEHRDALLAALAGPLAEHLIVEITETVLMDDDRPILDFLGALRAAGIWIALDDFGTGYSSLSYLRRFPIDVLKIDKSFVDFMERGTEDLALVATIASMGRTLGMRVVAEGVERESQVRSLIELGCGYIQGFYFAKPMCADDLADYLGAAASRKIA